MTAEPAPAVAAKHWCPGCWVEMPAGSPGKCRACVGPADSVWDGGMVHFFHDEGRPLPPMSDYRYHGAMHGDETD